MVPDYNLDTPEAISIRYDIAGIGTRFLAAALDFLIWAVLAVILIVGAIALSAFGVAGRDTALILLEAWRFLSSMPTTSSSRRYGKGRRRESER